MKGMARVALLAPLVFLCACGLEQSGSLPGIPDVVPRPDVEAGPDATPDATICGPCTKAGEFCKAGTCQLLTGCAEIHTIDPTAPSLRYDVRTASMGPADTVTVYCEMTKAGGGWTLIAATNALALAPAFGWGSPHKDPSTKDDAYALDLAKGFKFTKAMVTGHPTPANLDIGPPVITFDLPPLGPLGGSTTTTTGLKVVDAAPSCTTSDLPVTFNTLGKTALTDSFYFSTSSAISDVGIFPNQFISSVPTGCGGDQNLHLEQVMLFGHE